jgi:hypothetical protein
VADLERNALLAISGLFGIWSFSSYIWKMGKGINKVPITTCAAISVALTLAFVSAMADHAKPGVVVPAGVFAALSVIAFGVSTVHGSRTSRWSDWTCLVLALCGIADSEFADNPVLGVLFAAAADLAAYTPLVINLYRDPSILAPGAYILSMLSILIGIAPYIRDIGLAASFQIYLFCIDGVIVALIYRKQIARGVHKVRTILTIT